MKLWDKGFDLDEKVEAFTIGQDRELDRLLAPYDILGTIAHIRMLRSVGLLGADDLAALLPVLRALYAEAEAGAFTISPGVEDVHSEVEMRLVQAVGDIGKKVHTGRSRNDQVLLDLKLFTRARLERTVRKVTVLFGILQERSEATRDILLPGYTHLQVAMPSSFGLWFGAYGEALAEDLIPLRAAWELADRNPLGSAAGFGSSAPLDRALTTRLLGFADLDCNSVYAQLTRGHLERTVAAACAGLAETVGRLAADCCLYNSQDLGFLHLPDALTTGSSIMPHKKNPDVFELVRARCNRLQGIPGDIRCITGNLPSGYARDMQVLKELYLPLFGQLDDVLDIMAYAMSEITVETAIMQAPKYLPAFSVEAVNRLVSDGVPFRDAYRQVGEALQRGELAGLGAAPARASDIGHTHIGSLGDPANDRIAAKLHRILGTFPFDRVHAALTALLED